MNNAKRVYDILVKLLKENYDAVSTARVKHAGLEVGIGDADKYLRMGAISEAQRRSSNTFPPGLPYFLRRPLLGTNQKEWIIIKPWPTKSTDQSKKHASFAPANDTAAVLSGPLPSQ